MKRLFVAVLLLCLLVSMTGCTFMDYQKANKLYKKGAYDQAETLYQFLGDFADSKEMAVISGKKADYAEAEALYAAGDYVQALALYTGLEMYSDSPLKAVMCQYEAGKTCIAAGNYEEAVTWLEPLGNYEDSAEQLNFARWCWLGQQRHTKVIDAGSNRNRTISVEMPEKETLVLQLSDTGLLLGLPYKTEFEMTLVRGVVGAEYMLTYNSTNVKTITEYSTGTVELHRFAEGLPVTEFTQTITDVDGMTAESTNVADAIMMKAVAADTVAVIAEYLPQLLEASGVNISMTDFGF